MSRDLVTAAELQALLVEAGLTGASVVVLGEEHGEHAGDLHVDTGMVAGVWTLRDLGDEVQELGSGDYWPSLADAVAGIVAEAVASHVRAAHAATARALGLPA